MEEVGLKKHPDHPSLQVHVDRIIHPAPGDTRTGKGVLEIKAVGREMMRKIQDEGLPIDYIIQWEHGAACYDLNWGAFAIGTREDLLPLVAIEFAALMAGDPMPKLPRSPKIVHFEMEANLEIRQKIEEHGPKFWATLGDENRMPPRMDPEDPRCGRCVRKARCQGSALMEGIEPERHIPKRKDLAGLVEEYRMNVALLAESQELVDQTEDKFRAALDKTTAVRVPVGGEWKNVIYRIRNGANRVDGRAMAVQYDTLRRAAIAAGLPGADITPPSSQYARIGGPSRPLLLAQLLPRKPKEKGEVPEQDEE